MRGLLIVALCLVPNIAAAQFTILDGERCVATTEYPVCLTQFDCIGSVCTPERNAPSRCLPLDSPFCCDATSQCPSLPGLTRICDEGRCLSETCGATVIDCYTRSGMVGNYAAGDCDDDGVPNLEDDCPCVHGGLPNGCEATPQDGGVRDAGIDSGSRDGGEGDSNVGDSNVGDSNVGDSNVGDSNVGDSNVGDAAQPRDATKDGILAEGDGPKPDSMSAPAAGYTFGGGGCACHTTRTDFDGSTLAVFGVIALLIQRKRVRDR